MTENYDLDLSTEENGLDSLAHAVDHYLSEQPANYLKYVVLHTVHAVELLLKARLEAIDPDLVLREPNKRPVTDDSITLGFDRLVVTLRTQGVPLDPQDVCDLSALRRFRNRIEHRRMRANRSEVENFVGQAIRFLDRFTRDELHLNLRDQFDAVTYDTLIELLHGFEEASNRAMQEMNQFLGPDWEHIVFTEAIECPRCGNYTVAYPDPRFDLGRAQCFSPGCRATVQTAQCELCGGGVAALRDIDFRELVACDDCLHRGMEED
jgi:hypothetical protein